jgi:elongation factor 2
LIDLILIFFFKFKYSYTLDTLLRMSKRNASGIKNIINNLDNIRNISIIAHIDSGKCFTKGTPIMMSNGSTKYVEKIEKGDYVMGHNMKAGYITNVHNGHDDIYHINQNDVGLTYGVNGRHILVLQLVKDHLIEYDETNRTACLYYFENNQLCVIKRDAITLFDKVYLNMKVSMLKVISGLWQTLLINQNKRIARDKSWLYIPVEKYIKFPKSIQNMLNGIQLDWNHYNNTGNYKYLSTNINITYVGIDEYFGFEVTSNPLFMLSDGTVVHNSTLSDSLIVKAGFLAADKAGKACHTDTREDEKERGITIKSCSVSLHHIIPNDMLPYVSKKQPTNGNEFLINLIDSPGHVDFSSEVTAALRVTDGAVVVVECVGGVSVQTETVVRQSVQENIELVLMINKMDRAIVEQQLDPEALYQRFEKIIQDMNILMSTYGGERYPDNYFDPIKGNVVFGAAYHGWAFHLHTFAQMYSKINNMDVDKIIERLWGHHFINNKGKWTKTFDKQYTRGFVKMILEPIYMVYSIKTQDADHEPILKKLNKWGVKLSQTELTDIPKEILRAIMRRWLPAGDAVLEMIVQHLPSPKTAQKYRGKELYTGDLDSDIGQAIVNCDPTGPMTMFVSKMFPANDNRFYAFGRVFSGTIRNGQKVKIMGGNYVYGEKGDLVENQPIQRIVLMMARTTEPMTEVPCGNIVGLVGIDQHLKKTGTLSNRSDAYPIKPMKYSVSPVVRVAVEPKNVRNLIKLQQAIKKLDKSDPLVECTRSATGENIIAGAGELHVEICIHDLKKIANMDLIVSDPIVPYCETIMQPSMTCYTKSGSGLNRILIKAQPVPNQMVEDIINGTMSLNWTNKKLTRHMIDNYQFDISDFKRLWKFGPDKDTCTSVFTNDSKGVDNLDKVKDTMINGFRENIQKGILINEPVKGVQFKLMDATIHPDSAHHGADEIMPPIRKSMLAAMISGLPRLIEPVYMCQIYCPTDDVGTIYSFISQRRGEIFEEEPVVGNPMTILKSYLPVAESFGFTHKLREITHGRAFPTCVFDHWQIIDSDPYQEDSYAYKLVKEIRKRKGMSEDLPEINTFIDKMPKEFANKYSTD